MWDEQFISLKAARFFPNENLVKFLGRTYGQPWPIMTRCVGMTAMEIGCGAGGNLRALADWGFAFVGIDASVEAIKLAERLMVEHFVDEDAVKNIGLHVGDALNIGMRPEASFDLIVDVLCLQHMSVADRHQFYNEAFGRLNAGGRLFTQQWQRGDQPLVFPDHPELIDQDRGMLEADLAKVGFRIESSESMYSTYGHGTTMASWSVVVGRKP